MRSVKYKLNRGKLKQLDTEIDDIAKALKKLSLIGFVDNELKSRLHKLREERRKLNEL